MPGIPPSISPYEESKIAIFPKENKQSRSLSFLPQHIQKVKFLLISLFLLIATFLVIKLFFLAKQASPAQLFISVKSPLSDFIGRTEYLNFLEKELFSWTRRHKFHQSTLIKVLWGQGGRGKSELATAFANRQLPKFSFLWTFTCDSQEHIDLRYRQLAEELGIWKSHESSEKIREEVHFYLENHDFKLPWLLIFDNVEEELKDLPQRGGMILITSQKKILNPQFWVEVKPFSREESLLLFEKITQEKRSVSMEKLAYDLEDVPLLVHFVSHYIKAMPGCSIEEYQKTFASHLLKKENLLWKEGALSQRYSKNFLTSWEFPLKSLEKENLYALKWLCICGYLHPLQIREEWIDGWLAMTLSEDELLALCPFVSLGRNQETGSNQTFSSSANPTPSAEKILQDALLITRKGILQVLQKYGIIQYNEKEKIFSLHRFFQQMIRESRREQTETDLRQAIQVLRKYASSYHLKSMNSWREGEQWYSSAYEVAKWAEQLDIGPKDSTLNKMDQALIYEGIGEWCIFNGRSQEALTANYRVLNLRKEVMDKNSVEVGKAYECLGWNLYKLSRFHEALEACNQALEIELPTSVEYALTLATKGLILAAQGKYDEALQTQREALKIRLQQYGETHIQVGRSFYHISVCLRKLGKLTEALAQNEQALALYQKTCGQEHPWYNACIKNKGWIFFNQQKYQEALALFQQALSRYIALKGKDQIALGYCYNGIGWCYLQLKNTKGAIKAFEKSLDNSLKNPEGSARALAAAHHGLGLAYMQNGQVERGKKELESYTQTLRFPITGIQKMKISGK